MIDRIFLVTYNGAIQVEFSVSCFRSQLLQGIASVKYKLLVAKSEQGYDGYKPTQNHVTCLIGIIK